MADPWIFSRTLLNLEGSAIWHTCCIRYTYMRDHVLMSLNVSFHRFCAGALHGRRSESVLVLNPCFGRYERLPSSRAFEPEQ